MADDMTMTSIIAAVSVRAGDVVVLQCDQQLSSEAVELVRDRVKKYVPNNEVLILTSGLKLGVLRFDA